MRIPASSQAVTASAEAVTQYIGIQKQLKEQGVGKDASEEQLGPFHVHVSNGMLKALLADPAMNGDKKAKVQEYCNQVGHWKQMGYELKMYKISKMREPRYRRLEMRIEDSPQIVEGQVRLTSVMQIIMGWLMSQQGAKQLMGAAPSGHLARRLQKVVDETENDV